MIASERQMYIMNKLEEKGFVYLNETSKELGASICTIRRDFEKLEKENKCRRVHGGAVRTRFNNRVKVSTAIDMKEREELHPDIKRILCKKCAEIVEENDCIFIDGGTTFKYFCEYLSGKRIMIVTHSDFIRGFSDSTYSVYVLGGENNPFFRMNLGNMTVKMLESFYFDKAFISCAGIGMEHLDLFTGEIGTAQVKEAAMKKSRKSYLVADSSKIGIYGFYSFGSLNTMDALITDKPLNNIETSTEIILAQE